MEEFSLSRSGKRKGHLVISLFSDRDAKLCKYISYI